jgi:hypothetical protein
MANLSKIDSVEEAIRAAGITSEDDAEAIRDLVSEGTPIDVAIGAFAPTPGAALATQAQSVAPVVKGKGGKKPVNIQATPVIPVANSQYATDGEIAQVQEVAFEAGVNLASSLGNANRAGFASGFVAQASAEAEGTSNFREGLVAGFVASI